MPAHDHGVAELRPPSLDTKVLGGASSARPSFWLLAVLAILGPFFLPALATAQPLIHLRTGVIDPAAAPAPRVAAPVESATTPDGRATYILQLQMEPGVSERRALRAAGAELLHYIPDAAWLARLSPDREQDVAALPFVHWLGHYEAAFKIDPTLATQMTRSEFMSEVVISVLRPGYVLAIKEAIEQAGEEVVEFGTTTRWGTVRANVSAATLSQLATRAEVEWIEPFVQPELMNDVARRSDMLNVERVWNVHGLSGAGQIVAVADSGLCTGDLETIHPDFQGRVQSVSGWVDPDFWGDASSHGTHVAGSVLGSGAAFGDGQYSGIAPAAALIMQAIGDPQGGSRVFLPTPLNRLFESAHELGAHIHTDSWGSSVYGAYTSFSREADEFMWDYDDLLILTSAGNSGKDTNRDGVIDPQSIGAPASAKNVLTVGAAESDRPAGSGGLSGLKWGTGGWLANYPVNPIRDDLISTSADGTHQGMAAFSSRGPTQDGRTKPDIVGPGTDIISARSLYPNAGPGWGVVPGAAGDWYLFMGGTSMSTPLVAGAATLAREYLTERRGIANPSAALQKALLVNGARSLAPGQYGTGIYQEIPFGPRPNMVEGWGQVDLEYTLYPASGATNWLWDRHAVTTGQTNRYPLVVDPGNTNAPVRVTLAWSDFPASLTAARQLVNDLDLRVITANGAVIHPSGRAHPDRINNLLGIDWDTPQAGTNWVEVVGHNVPMTPQRYALVVKGVVDAPAQLGIFGLWTTATQVLDNARPVIQANVVGGSDGVWTAALYWSVNGGTEQVLGMMRSPEYADADIFVAQLPLLQAGDHVEYYVRALDFGFNTTVSATQEFEVHSHILHVHPDGQAIWPYQDWANAFRHPQAALQIALPGQTVLVADGTYTGQTLIVDQAITLQSVNSAAHTVIDGGMTRRALQMTADAEVSGFTFQRGLTGLDGGAVWMDAGHLSHSVIKDSRALYFGGGLYMEGGTVEHVRIFGNRADWYGGGVLMQGDVLQHALIYDNHADRDAGGVEFWGGTLRNCTIAFNHADEYGGGLDVGASGDMRDNIVVYNTADIDGDNWYLWVDQDFEYTLTSPSPNLTGMAFTGCFDADPLFADAEARDFRLLSAYGRYLGDGVWTNDAVTSPAIDMGDPDSDFSAEPEPHGGRVNLGAYGNTPTASKGPAADRKLLVYADPQSPWPAIETAAQGTPLALEVDPVMELGHTQYVHTGWTLTGLADVDAQTGGTNILVELELTDNAILRRHWQTNFYVSAYAAANGTVHFEDDWYAAGSEAQLTAEPDLYYTFASWTGTWTSVANPLSLVVDGPHELTAMFAVARTSQGTPHYWLAGLGWTNDFEAAALADSDGDGVPNWQEYIAGTDPLDSNSVLRVGFRPRTNGTDLRWRAQPGRRYRLLQSDDLLHGEPRVLWQFDAFTGMTLSYPLPDPETGTGFFWIEVEKP